jgi:hypothetical protein
MLLALAIPSALYAEAAGADPATRPDKVSAGGGGPAAAPPAEPDAAVAAEAREKYGRLPLSFEANRGQAAGRADFIARNSAYSVRLAADEVALVLRDASAPTGARARAAALKIRLLGASRGARASGLEELEGRSNYLFGGDPSRWRRDVPNYAKVRYEGVYPGVDVVYYGTLRQLEYDFNVAPGADAGRIRLRVEGAGRLRVDADGDLVLPTAAGEVRQRAPRAYQEVGGGRRVVACRYALRGGSRVGFELGEYDRERPLVIDPVVSYSTYLGGDNYDHGTAIAVDAYGAAYVTGFATSFNFPVTPGALQQSHAGPRSFHPVHDAFVAKLNPAGTAFVYSTYLGGDGNDVGSGIAVDGAGQAYVAGATTSTNFPTTPGAYRAASAGGQDVFVSKLDAAGSALLYSTYLGGADDEFEPRLALAGGDVYVAGPTQSADFPVTPGAFQTQPRALAWNSADVFVTKLSATPGAGLAFSTFIGGGGDDRVGGLAVAPGPGGSVYVAGRTRSPDFPVTPGAHQPWLGGDGSTYDAFVARLDAAGSALVYSTYFGGWRDEGGAAVAVDAGGAAYFAGSTSSEFFPISEDAFQKTYAGGPAGGDNTDAFVAKLGPEGGLVYSTYYGGHGGDNAHAVAVDAQGSVYVAGDTNSADLPVTPGGFQSQLGGGLTDGFLFKLDPAGSSLDYGTYLGGDYWEQAVGVAVDAQGSVYLTGNTYSQNFVTTTGAPRTQFGGGADVFVTKVALGAQGYKVSGRVTNQHGAGLRDAEVVVSGVAGRAARTDADGYYAVEGLAGGADYTLTASRDGFVFEPQGVTLSNLGRDETVNFSGPAPLRVSGHVIGETGMPMSVLVRLSSTAGDAYTFSDYDGSYSFLAPAGGSCAVTPGPGDPDYTFTPESRTVDDLTADQTFDFTGHLAPRVIGRVLHDEYNYGLPDIRVTLTGPSLPEPVVQTTDSAGYFFFEGLERGATYTVTPSDPATNRSFAPTALTIPDMRYPEFVEFRALRPLAIHGRVTDPEGNPVTGVATLTGAVNAETEVDQWGHFDFMNLPRGGDYTVTVSKPGSLYTFAPPSRGVSNLQDFQAFNFTALPPLRIRGRVSEATGGYYGVRATLTLGGTVSATTQADEWGFYEFAGLPRGGSYTVTAAYPLYTFAPASRGVSDAQEDQFLPFEALPPLRVDGILFDGAGGGVAGATVTLAGAVNASAVTDEHGAYGFRDLPRGGDYTVTPAHELYIFTPQSLGLNALDENRVAVFTGTLRRHALSGRVRGPGGAALPGVTMTLGGSSNALTQTDANGDYAFPDLAAGRGYTIEAARPGYSFAPASFGVADLRGDRTADFAGSRLSYSVGGRVTDAAGGAGLAGVTVSLGGSLTATAQTDAQGGYTFAGLPSEGDYTLTAAHPNFAFTPAARTLTNLLDDAGADFSGARLRHQVGGRVADNSGAPLAGVAVTLSGARAATTQTDSFGLYVFADLPSGLDYAVTAAKNHYTFAPPTRRLDGLGGDATADFTATLLTHAIGGRVVDSNGAGFAGAAVQLIGPGARVVTTDATGAYSFAGLPAGQSYTVQPSREFYDFSPTRGVFDDLGSDQTANFTAALRAFSVGGRVTEGANGVAGVTVSLSGSRTATTQTDASGAYVFASLPADGAYAVTPSHPFYAFAPGGASFNTLPSNRTANFAAARLLYQIGGHARDACGRALAGVTMSLTHDGVTATAQTDAAGFYAFTGVQAGYDYALAPAGSAYAFAPASLLFPALNASQAAAFTGTPPVATDYAAALADLYVRGGTSAGANFGTATQLVARLASQAKDTYETYVKFDAGRPCTVTSVKLRLYGRLSGAGTLPVAAYAVPVTTWTEGGVNWNNRPAAGAALRTVNVVGTTAAWYEWDVTDYVRGELNAGRGVVSFVLKGTSAAGVQATFNSREAAGAGAPRLAVTTP